MFKKKLGNKGFAITSVLYTLLVAFLLFLGAALAEFSTSAKLLSKANEDLTDGFDIKAVYIDGSNETESTINVSDFPYTPPEPSKEGYTFKNFEATISCDNNAHVSYEALPITYGKLKTFLKDNKCIGDIKIEYKAVFEQNAVIPSEYKLNITYIDENGGDMHSEDKTIRSDDSLDINKNIKPGYEITHYTDRYKYSGYASLNCSGGSTYVRVGLPISYNTLREKCNSAIGTLELRVTYAKINELDNVDVNVYYWLPRYSTVSSGVLNEISGKCGLYYTMNSRTNIYKTVKYKNLTINEINNATNRYWTLKGCNAKFTLKDTNGNYYNSPTSYGCDPERYIKPEIEKLYNQNSKPQLSSIDLYVRRINDDSSCRAP